MSDAAASATPPVTPQVIKAADFNVTAPEFIPKQTKALVDLSSKLIRTLEDESHAFNASCLPVSASTEGIDIPCAPEDALPTPTPTSISSFTQLVKLARAALESEPQGSDVSMLSMTDDDSEISSADVSFATEPKTPIFPAPGLDQDDLDVSPTGGLGGGVRCGISKPEQQASVSIETAPKNDKFKEGLELHTESAKPKYRPFPPQRSCNIHIQNLPEHYGDAELSALCEEFGHVVSVRVFRRPVAAPPNRRLPDGQHSTYGFVLFDNVHSAENCVNTLRRRYKNIYPSFARQAAPAVHQPAFVGLLEAIAYGDLHGADSDIDMQGCYNTNPGMGADYSDASVLGPVYAVPPYEASHAPEVPAVNAVQPIFTLTSEASQPSLTQPTLVSAPLDISQNNATRPRALTIKPMPPPIQSYLAPSSTVDRLNSVLEEPSILLIVDGLPKDFGVGLLDTLFAPHPIHDVRLHRKATSGSVRGSVRVSSRLAALQSIEKLTGMQFGGLADGLQVRLAEEVPGSESDSKAAPGLPSYRTLPDIQEYQTALAPPAKSALASSISAPEVASMIGSGLNALLFASQTCENLAQRLSPSMQLSPSTGNLLTPPARLQVPFTPPGLINSVSMPQVASRHMSQSFGLSPSLRVGNVMLPISNIRPSESTLYACSNASSTHRLDKSAGLQVTPEPPVIKVTSYAGAVKKSTVKIDSPKGGASSKKKRKSLRSNKACSGKGDSSKNSPEVVSEAVMDITPSESNSIKAEAEKSAAPEKPVAQPKPVASKSKKWSMTRRRANSKSKVLKD